MKRQLKTTFSKNPGKNFRFTKYILVLPAGKKQKLYRLLWFCTRIHFLANTQHTVNQEVVKRLKFELITKLHDISSVSQVSTRDHRKKSNSQG